jgi:hypothetical protein
LERNLHNYVLDALKAGGDPKVALKLAFLKADQYIIDVNIKYFNLD